nr:MAG TPA: hypothetical protein [Caudoviricetes sp.]
MPDDVPTITPKELRKGDVRTNALMMQAKCATSWRAFAHNAHTWQLYAYF